MTSKELVKVNDNNTKNNNEYLKAVEYYRKKLTEFFDSILIPNAWKKPYSWEDKKEK